MAHGGLRSVWAATLGALIGAAGTSAALTTPEHDLALPPEHAADDAAARKDPLTRLLELATRRAIEEGESPAVRRGRLLERIANGHQCFVNNPTPEQLANIEARFAGRNPAERMGQFANRFLLQNSAWNGSGNSVTTVTGRGERINLLTYSFPDDNTEWLGNELNELNAKLANRFGTVGIDAGRELFRQTLAGWRLYCGVDYLEVCDNNDPLSNLPPPSFYAHGDIRFGANSLGTDAGILALNYFPEAGGDMILNADYFRDATNPGTPDYYAAGGSGNYRLLRNAIAHEHGHGLGFRHVIPCFEQKLMEPFASSVYDTITPDERRGAQHNYGDRYAGNHSPATARELGLHQPMRAPVPGMPPVPGLAPGSPRYASTGTNYPQAFPLDRTDPTIGLIAHSVVERDLSTNGRICGMIREDAQPADAPVCTLDPMNPFVVSNPTGQDWFKFSIENPQEIAITVDPTGGFYDNGRQVNMCVGPFQRIFADRAGNLNLQLYRQNAMGDLELVAESSSAVPGQNEVVETTIGQPFAAGTYFIRVYDVGPNTISIDNGDPDPVTGIAPKQVMPTQLYDLFVRLGPRDTPVANQQLQYAPRAIAGVDKVATINAVTSFIGDIYSRINEPGFASVTQRLENFEWDLDGNGSFEVTAESFNNPPPGTPANSPRTPFQVYGPPNRIVPVTLKIISRNPIDNPVFTTHTDTIFVKVVGEPISITAITPNTGVAGTIVPITITGTGLGAVTDPRQINFFDPNVQVVGVPRVSTDGTMLDNVAVVIASTAAPGPRDLQVTDGCAISPVLPMSFIVTQPVPPPPQDECPGAVTWPADFGAKNFDSTGATTAPGQTYPGTPCAGQVIEGDVWYRWTVPACTSPTIIATPSTGVGFDVRMAVYTACPGGGTLITCGSTFPLRIPVTAGQELFFRIGGSGPGQTGPGTVTLASDPADPIGACCRPGLLCFCTSQSQCRQGGDTFIASGSCTPEPCPGRCCFDDGTCLANIQQAACNAAAGGLWSVAGTTCGPSACPQGQACCTGASCIVLTAAACTASGGRPVGPGSGCTPNDDCFGACCDDMGNCTVVSDSSTCVSPSFYRGNGTTCVPNICEPPSACCDGQTCTLVVPRNCISGDARPAGTACAPNNECAGACCDGSGVCMIVANAGACASGSTYLGNGTACMPNVCPQPLACCSGTNCRFVVASACTNVGETPLAAGTTCSPSNSCTGACCQSSGLCLPTTAAACTGNFLGGGTVCSPNPCPQPVACCNGTNCRFVFASACTNAGEVPQGAGTTCAPDNDCGGACCAIDGTCTLTTQTGCTGTSVFRGDGTTCSAGVCAAAGACCDGTTCLTRTAAACGTISGAQFLGAGVACAAPTCTPAACCNAGICTIVLPSNCSRFGGVPVASSTCSPDPCVAAACCDGLSCTVVLANACAASGGQFFDGVSACAATTCDQGACCSSSGCAITFEAGCSGAGQMFQGAGTTCTPDPCAMGACCEGVTCRVVAQSACTGIFTRFVGSGAACNVPGNYLTPCCRADYTQDGSSAVGDIFEYLVGFAAMHPRADYDQNGTVDVNDLFTFLAAWFIGCSGAPSGGCCLPNSTCALATDANCVSQGGVYQGDASSCTPDPCPTLAMGACCTGASCTAQMAAACTGPNTFFAGSNTTCNVPPINYTTPCCLADFNHVGGVTVQDIFDYFNAYFAGDPDADYDRSGTVTVSDLLSFLAAYFAGGC